MGKTQRVKGAAYEREVCAAFRDAWQVDAQRRLGQARDGGSDIEIGRFVIECKRRKSLTTLRTWYEQARRVSATRTDPAVPMVVCREDHGDSYVVLSLADFLTIVPRPADAA